jgi:hypothetical protein
VTTNPGERPAPARSVALIILGSVLGLIALALLTGGGTALWADQSKRDSDGYFTGSTHRIANDSYAVTHDGATVKNLPGWADDGNLAKIRIAAASDTGRPVFVGIARERDADAYLANVAHANLDDYGAAESKQEYDLVSGAAVPLRPASQDIWVASATSTDAAALKWNVREGDWTVVLMNADASKGVAADVKLGVDVGYLGWLSAALLAIGGILATAAVFLILHGGRRKGPQVPQANTVPAIA